MTAQHETKDTKSGTGLAEKNDPDAVNSPSAAYTDWMDRSLLPRTLLGGEYAMLQAGTACLPKNELESPTAYKTRLERSTLLNGFKKTCHFLAGQVFQADIVMDDAVPEIFKKYKSKVDAAGNALDVFAKRLFINGIGKGVSLLMVDVPKKKGENLTVKEEEELGIRPFFREIRPEDVIGGIVEDGALTQVRLRESTTKRVGKYGTKPVTRIRVLEPGRWELHEIDDDGASDQIDSGEFSVNIIPLLVFIPGEEWSILTGESPLMDLATLNRHHWRSQSDQNNILHVARVPFLAGKGYDLEKMVVNVKAMITSDEEWADIKWVEVTGAALAAGRQDLVDTEGRMSLYGLQQLLPRTGNMTATEKAITSAESSSNLGTWATEFEDFLIAAYTIWGLFVKKEFPVEGLTVNKEYNLGIASPEELNALYKAEDQDILSKRAVFKEMRRRGIIDEHHTWEDMEADREKEQRDNPDFKDLAGTMFGGAGAQEGAAQ